MDWLVLLAAIIIFCFGGVLLFGAPYLPTLSPQVKTALKLADLEKGQTLLELGCGDGKVLIAAAKQGLNAVGYELNPIMAAIAWLRTRRYKRQVKVICGDFWRADWPPAEAIFVFLHPRFMAKLNKKIVQHYTTSVKLVSFAFEIPDKQAVMKKNGVFLYDFD